MKYVNSCREILTIHSVQTTQTHHCIATVCVIPSYEFCLSVCLSVLDLSACEFLSLCMSCLSTCLSVCHKMYTREESKTYHLFLFAGCKDLATPLSCTPRFIYKTAVSCEKTFLKNFMGREKPNCGYVILSIIVFVYLFLCLGKPWLLQKVGLWCSLLNN